MEQFNQPMPVQNNEPYIQDQVIADMEERKAHGIAQYGTGLQPFNGRNAPVDAYEEALDLTNYLKTWVIERERIVEAFKLISQASHLAVAKLEAIQVLVKMGEWDERGSQGSAEELAD